MTNLLITGATHEDRLAYVLDYCRKILCLRPQTGEYCGACSNCERIINKSHPNITFVEPASQEIKIDDIRRIIIENHKVNYEPGSAFFVITHMHQTTKAAANALLKVIEDSASSKIFLALAPSRTAVLPTIASRLVSHIVKAHSHDIISEETCKNLWRILKTKPSARFMFCTNFSLDRDELLAEIQNLETACHVLLRAYFEKNSDLKSYAISPIVAVKLGDALTEAYNQLTRNLNPRLVYENLVLRHWPYAHAHQTSSV